MKINKEELKKIYRELEQTQALCCDAVRLENDEELNTEEDIYSQLGDMLNTIEEMLGGETE